MKDKINAVLKAVIKFNLPNDYPDELVDSHIEMIKNQFEVNKNKIKRVLKINNKQLKP